MAVFNCVKARIEQEDHLACLAAAIYLRAMVTQQGMWWSVTLRFVAFTGVFKPQRITLALQRQFSSPLFHAFQNSWYGIVVHERLQ